MSLRLSLHCMSLRNLRNEGRLIFGEMIRILLGQVFYEVAYGLEFTWAHGAFLTLNASSSYFSNYSEPFWAFWFSSIHSYFFLTPVFASISFHTVTPSAVFLFFPPRVSKVIIFSQHWPILTLLTDLLRNSTLSRLVMKCYHSWKTIQMTRSVIISLPFWFVVDDNYFL